MSSTAHNFWMNNDLVFGEFLSETHLHRMHTTHHPCFPTQRVCSPLSFLCVLRHRDPDAQRVTPVLLSVGLLLAVLSSLKHPRQVRRASARAVGQVPIGEGRIGCCYQPCPNTIKSLDPGGTCATFWHAILHQHRERVRQGACAWCSMACDCDRAHLAWLPN